MNTPASNQPGSPSCHDTVTITTTTPCPVCQHPFTPVGRQTYCGDACRAAAYRRRRHTPRAPITIPKTQPRRPITVYQCDTCAIRTLGTQRCNDCGTFMRRIGIGGPCPSCDEPIAINELDLTTTT